MIVNIGICSLLLLVHGQLASDMLVFACAWSSSCLVDGRRPHRHVVFWFWEAFGYFPIYKGFLPSRNPVNKDVSCRNSIWTQSENQSLTLVGSQSQTPLRRYSKMSECCQINRLTNPSNDCLKLLRNHFEILQSVIWRASFHTRHPSLRINTFSLPANERSFFDVFHWLEVKIHWCSSLHHIWEERRKNGRGKEIQERKKTGKGPEGEWKGKEKTKKGKEKKKEGEGRKRKGI